MLYIVRAIIVESKVVSTEVACACIGIDEEVNGTVIGTAVTSDVVFVAKAKGDSVDTEFVSAYLVDAILVNCNVRSNGNKLVGFEVDDIVFADDVCITADIGEADICAVMVDGKMDDKIDDAAVLNDECIGAAVAVIGDDVADKAVEIGDAAERLFIGDNVVIKTVANGDDIVLVAFGGAVGAVVVTEEIADMPVAALEVLNNAVGKFVLTEDVAEAVVVL